MDTEIFSFLFTVTSCQDSYCLSIVSNLIYSLGSMCLHVVEIQYNDK